MDYVFVKSQKKGYENYGSLRARIRHEDKVYKISLGITIKETEWTKYKTLKYISSATMTSLGIRYGQFANMLMQIKHSLESSFVPEQASSIIHSIVYSNINNTSVEAPAPIKKSDILLRDYITTYADDLKTGVRTKQRHSTLVSEGYINNIKALLNNLKGYEVTIKRRVKLDDVTMLFQRQFVKYLRDIGHKPNTISGRLSCLRTIMQVAFLEKKTTSIDHQNPQFVPAREEVDEIFLRPEQITQMQNLDISSKEVIQGYVKKYKLNKNRQKPLPLMELRFIQYLNYTRDVFVVGCLTGQRFSDYSRISSGMIETLNGKQFIRLVQQKTGKQVYIPLDSRVKAILDKYDGTLPYVSKRTFRHHLHLLGEFLGWTHIAVFDSNDNTEQLRFCDMLTTHTARRSFATNAYTAGIRLASIIAVTGHSSERSFRTYLRMDVQEKATMAAESFKGFIEI